MKKSDIKPLPQFFDRYINLAEDIDLIEALEKHSVFSDEQVKKWKAIGDFIYAPGKWTVKDIFQHIIDNERIQAYRALRFARNDKTILPGFDEKLLADNADTSSRTLEDLLAELNTVRATSIHLFKNLKPVELQRRGVCFNTDISVLALGFVLVGHQIHHLNVIEQRYYPLLQEPIR